MTNINKIPEVWFSSDWHFSHANILKFTNYDGQKVRPEFSSVEEMNEVMIERHNATVPEGAKFYHLGDVGFNQNELDNILPKLNGKKRLILGNHDGYDAKFYRQHFQKLLVSWRPIYGLVFSHYPLYIGEGDKGMLVNCHGHIHRGQIDDPRYLNISVEETNYTPVSFDQIYETFKSRGFKISPGKPEH